jgi:hypothetical protein
VTALLGALVTVAVLAIGIDAALDLFARIAR